MSTNDLHDLLAPYVLDALDADERTRFRSHLDSCATCREELEGFAATATLLGASAAEEPPAGLRGRLLDAVASTPQERPTVVALRPRSAVRRFLPGTIAAAAVLVAAAGVTGYVREHDRVTEIQAQQSTYEQVMTAQDAARTSAELDGGRVTMIASQSADAAVLITSGLPAQDDRDYQLWAIHGEEMVSVGVLGSADMLLVETISTADGVAITVEPKGGSDQPTSEPIAAMDV